MKEKNLPDDIDLKSLNELTELANNIIENLEKKNELENSVDEYQKLLKLNDLISNPQNSLMQQPMSLKYQLHIF